MSQVNISAEWHDEKIPIVNGIIYSDGSIDCINVDYNTDKREIVHGSKIHINDLISNNELDFSNIIVNKKIEILDKQINVYCGEGSFGGEGFVVVESLFDLQIKWIALFEAANPFEKLEIIGDKIITYNNLNEKWTFDINNPSKVSITPSP